MDSSGRPTTTTTTTSPRSGPDIGSAGPSEDDVIRTQIESLLEIMMAIVQDRVRTHRGIADGPSVAGQKHTGSADMGIGQR